MWAAETGGAAVVAQLLAEGADGGAASGDGSTALLLAARSGHAEVARLIVATAGVDANAVDRQSMTSLMCAYYLWHISYGILVMAY